MTFEQFCAAHGLVLKGGLIVGRWMRVPTTDKPHKRNGAYKFMGDHGFVQNHATMQEVATWRAEGDSKAGAMREIDHAAIARHDQAQREKRIAAVHGARGLWDEARPTRQLHPYLHRKGLSPAGTAFLREWDGVAWHDGQWIEDRWLVVPMHYHAGRIVNVQRISTKGVKVFFPGAPVSACYATIERPGAAVTVIAEGLSTGLAIFQSVRMARVVVAFNAGNLLKVIEHLRPSGCVIVAADNDHGTAKRIGHNPGIEHAQKAAGAIGAGVTWPTGIEGTDWADALAEWGEGAASRIARSILAGAKFVLPATQA